jgi:TRAP-type transport system periplasmic protein
LSSFYEPFYVRGEETMKKLAFLAMAVLFVFTIASVSAVQAQELKKIPLVYTDHIPPMAGGNIFIKQIYLPRIQAQLAKIGYQLDITFYHAGSLYKYSDQVQAVDQGLVDITVAVIPYETARAPLHEILDFGFMGWDHMSMLKVWSGLKARVPAFGAEFSKGTVELFRFVPSKKLIHHNIPGAKVPADFKGKKIHCTGISADMIRYIGGVPIRQNPGDWYTSLDRGLFDGIIISFDMPSIFKLYEVLQNHVFATGDSFGYTPVTHLMNRKKFQSLPPGVQKVLMDNFDWASESITEYEQGHVEGYYEGAKKKGNNFIYLTREETELWRQAARTVQLEWVEKLEKKGIPARETYNEALKLSDQYTE